VVGVRASRIALAVAALVLAVLAAVAATDVRAWTRSVPAGDATYAVAPLEATWTPSTRLPTSFTRDLLGLQDDLAMRHALQLYGANVGARPRLDNASQVAAARAASETALAQVARGSDASRDSQAETLLAVLAYGDFAEGGQASQADQAVSALQDAVKLDPDNVTAKYDLELLLRLLAAHGVQPGSQAGTGFGPGRHGAAGGVRGRGY
jgi:hypothetical protein